MTFRPTGRPPAGRAGAGQSVSSGIAATLLALLAAPPVLPPQVTIDGFGVIDLRDTGGLWVFDRTNVPVAAPDVPRVVIFRRPAPFMERLTLIRYVKPKYPGPYAYLDSVLDSTPLGVPWFLLTPAEKAAATADPPDERGSSSLFYFEPLGRADRVRDADFVGITCLHPRRSETRPHWMSQAEVRRLPGGDVLAVILSSERVVLPEAVMDVPNPFFD